MHSIRTFLAPALLALSLAGLVLIVIPPPAGARQPAAAPGGGGALLVAPTRVVFEGRQRHVALTLVNRGSETATYRIQFIHMRMSEHGAIEEAREPAAGERPADPLVRYSPRQVTLRPGERQVVRLMVRRPAGLEAGEYRSHLHFRYVPQAATNAVAGSAVEPAGLQQGVSIRLTPLVGVAIPVIVRHGDTRVAVRIRDLMLVDGRLRMVLDRRGNRSVLGTVVVEARGPDGRVTEVSRVRGLGLYTPNLFRRVEIPIDRGGRGTLATGQVVEVRFENAEEGPDRGQVLAQARLRVP